MKFLFCLIQFLIHYGTWFIFKAKDTKPTSNGILCKCNPSTVGKVLQYDAESTPVLSGKYWSTLRTVLESGLDLFAGKNAYGYFEINRVLSIQKGHGLFKSVPL